MSTAAKDPALLLEAIAWAKTAALTAPPHGRFAVDAALAGELRDVYERERSEESLRQAIEAYRTAVVAGLPRHPASVLTQAISWGAWAMNRSSWEEAAEAARAAIMAADQLAQRQASLRHQGYWFENSLEVHEARSPTRWLDVVISVAPSPLSKQDARGRSTSG